MGVTIAQTYAAIGVERTPQRFEINKKNAGVSIESTTASLILENSRPFIEIDQYDAFASSGLMGPVDLSRNAAAQGRQQALEFIAKTAADGRTYAAIENGGNPIASIAARDAWPENEFGMVMMPSTGPHFSVRDWKSDIRFFLPETRSTVKGVDIEYEKGALDVYYAPSRVNAYIRQPNSITVSFDGKLEYGTSIDVYV